MPNEIGPTSSTGDRVRARPPGPGAQADRRRAGQGEVGRDPDLRERRLAGAQASGPEHPLEAAGPPLPEPERRIDASEPGQKVQLGLRLRRPALRHQGHRLAVHRDRCRLVVRLAELRTSERNPAPATPASYSTASPASSSPPAGSWARSAPTTALSSAPERSPRRSSGSAPASASSRPAAPTPTAASNASSLTSVEECWRPSFARSLVPKITALQRDLDEYLDDYNHYRAHTGRHTKGRVPADIVFGARKTRT
jgi:hypothetical protein